MDISVAEFESFRGLLFKVAGINLSSSKRTLVMGRLAKRIGFYQLKSYTEYYRMLMQKGNEAELQVAVDLLTTNETHFFRESKHFDFMRAVLSARPKGQMFRVWSAACSTGEEPYSIAMQLADQLGDAPWEVMASDLSTQVLEKAKRGLFPMLRAKEISQDYLERFCLKGVGSQDGSFLVSQALRARVSFMQINLNVALPELGLFDMIFLRNVMIYFDNDTKRAVVHRMLPLLKPDGHLLIGHSESLNGVTEAYRSVQPAVYQSSSI